MIGCASGKSKLLLASPLTNIYFPKMSLPASKTFALALVLVCAFGAEQASARSKKPRLEPSSGPSVISVPSIMVDESGTPVIMQGLERPRRAIQDGHRAKKEAERRANIPRSFRRLPRSEAFRERPCWCSRRLSLLTTHRPSATPANASCNLISLFR
jgi:hypothetical protein